MERALCQLRTVRNSVITSVAIHCSFFSASFKLHVLCHKKNVLFLFSVSQQNWFQQQLAVEWNIRVKCLAKKKEFMTKL